MPQAVSSRTQVNGSCPAWVPYAAAFLVPALVLLAAYAANGVWPFGDTTFLMEDEWFQYYDLFGWLQRVLHGEGTLLYSFGKSLGGNMLPTYLYYLASPFNWLLVFLQQDQILGYLFAMRFVRCGLAGLTMFLYLRRRFGTAIPWVYALSSGYALSQHFLTQISNDMWLDAVWLLPLVGLGIWRLVQTGRWRALWGWMCLGIVSCWYTGYMLVIASIMLVVIELLVWHRAGASWHEVCRRAARYCLVMLLVAACCAVVLVPALWGLKTGKGTEPVEYARFLGVPISQNPIRVATALFFGQYVSSWATPQFFVGSLNVVLLFSFLFARPIPRRERLWGLLLLIALVLMASVAPLNNAWTGFGQALNYYCRWGFVVEFFLLWFGALALRSLVACEARDIRSWRVALMAGLAVCLLFVAVGCWKGSWTGIEGIASARVLAVTAVAFVAAFVVLLVVWVGLGQTARRRLAWAVVALAVVELGLNVWTVVAGDQRVYKTQMTVSELESYDTTQAAYVDAMKEAAGDEGFYRVEQLTSRITPESTFPVSEPLAYGYDGVNTYLSTNDERVTEFFQAVGYSTRPAGTMKGEVFHTTYLDPTVPLDSLLGLRYVSSPWPLAGFSNAGVDAENSYGCRWYENDEVIPILMSVAGAADVSMDSNNSFENQNEFFAALTGVEEPVFVPLKVSEQQDGDSFVWTVEREGNDVVYGEISASSAYLASGSLNPGTVRRNYFMRFSNGIFDITGDTVEASAPGLGDDPYVELNAYTVDWGTWARVRAALADRFELTGQSVEDGRVSLDVTASSDGLAMLSVPYDEGWTLTVDGVEQEPTVVAGTFIGVELQEGEHAVELRYLSPGLVPGAVVTAVGLCVTGNCVREKRKARRRLRKGTDRIPVE